MNTAVTQERLLGWYDCHARDLPWRRDCSPYRVLLSELMCQQTRVDTAIPYFERFVARWPTLGDLAAASEQQVLGEWAGLGYYSRARNLHRCAKAAAESGLPESVAALRKLPGIGPYTAGAIASIAFGIRAPVVDGNVERVLSRFRGLEADPRAGPGKKALWALADELVPADRPGDFNQALMELGALVCTPRKPACAQCPLTDGCIARAQGRQLELPARAARKKPVNVAGRAGLWIDRGRILLGRRPAKGLLPDLWEPISTAWKQGAPDEGALLGAFAARAGANVERGRLLGRVVHVFSHRRLVLDVYEVSGALPDPGQSDKSYYQAVRWVDLASPDVPLSKLAQKTIALCPPQPSSSSAMKSSAASSPKRTPPG